MNLKGIVSVTGKPGLYKVVGQNKSGFILETLDEAKNKLLINPNTRTAPVFRSRADAELTKKIYRKVPVLLREAAAGQPEINPWGV